MNCSIWDSGKIKIWEWVTQPWECHNERLLLNTFSETVLVNKLIEYLYVAKILSYKFGCLRAKTVTTFSFSQIYDEKEKKYEVLLLLLFIVLASISYYLHKFLSLLITFFYYVIRSIWGIIFLKYTNSHLVSFL